MATRAARLRRYLAKRIVRGEISPGDEIALIGHSTGGLDIRRHLCDLYDRRLKPILVDGGAKVAPRKILGRIRRVVFLSVPHWGTNIADWVRSHGPGRQAVIAQLRAAVAGSQVPVLDWIENSIAGSAAALTGTGLLRAVQDSLREAEEPSGKDPEGTLDAHEAASWGRPNVSRLRSAGVGLGLQREDVPTRLDGDLRLLRGPQGRLRRRVIESHTVHSLL